MSIGADGYIQHCWKSSDDELTETWCGQPRDETNREHQASATMEEANTRPVCAKCHRAVMHFKGSPAQVEYATEQLGLFLNIVDHNESGTPLWDDLGEDGRIAYRKDASRIIEALMIMGWRTPRGQVA